MWSTHANENDSLFCRRISLFSEDDGLAEPAAGPASQPCTEQAEEQTEEAMDCEEDAWFLELQIAEVELGVFSSFMSTARFFSCVCPAP